MAEFQGLSDPLRRTEWNLEILDPSEIRRRWPQFQPRDEMIGAFDSMSGVLFPEKCVAAHLDSANQPMAQTFTTTSRYVVGILTAKAYAFIPITANTPRIRSFSALAHGIPVSCRN